VGTTLRKRRVLVFSNHSLLISGVLSLLREHPEIEVIAGRGDEGDLYRQMREAAPEVVIIDADRGGADGGLGIPRFLRDHPDSTLLALSLDHPGMAVLRARRVGRATLEALVSIVDGARRKSKRQLASRKDAGRSPAPVKEGA